MDIAPNISYVLMTQEGTYLVEYLIGEVVFTSSISRAMIFSDVNIALKFKTLLYDRFKIKVSVNTYIYWHVFSLSGSFSREYGLL